MVEVTPYEWAVLMTNLNLQRWTLQYTVQASDEEYSIETEGEFVFYNSTLSEKMLLFRIHLIIIRTILIHSIQLQLLDTNYQRIHL